MASFPVIVFLLIIILTTELQHTSSTSCKTKCGSIDIKYPFGSGHGCGSPRFYPYVHCQGNGDGDDHQQLVLTTHTGSYPITSISYNTATLTITPPFMSTCTAMQPAPNFGLDWPGPFQLGSSIFILLSCAAPTSSFTVKGAPICDQSSYAHLCASIHTCPAVTSLGLSLFGPTNTCCVYNPANLNSKGDLDIQSLKCTSYASVLSFGDVPTDPNRWVYGIELQYSRDGMDNNIATSSCVGCERSNGVCGYTPPQNNFVCVCGNGVNSSSDCYNQVVSPYPLWSSGSPRVGGFNHYYNYVVLSVVCVALVFFCCN